MESFGDYVVGLLRYVYLYIPVPTVWAIKLRTEFNPDFFMTTIENLAYTDCDWLLGRAESESTTWLDGTKQAKLSPHQWEIILLKKKKLFQTNNLCSTLG